MCSLGFYSPTLLQISLIPHTLSLHAPIFNLNTYQAGNYVLPYPSSSGVRHDAWVFSYFYNEGRVLFFKKSTSYPPGCLGHSAHTPGPFSMFYTKTLLQINFLYKCVKQNTPNNFFNIMFEIIDGKISVAYWNYLYAQASLSSHSIELVKIQSL